MVKTKDNIEEAINKAEKFEINVNFGLSNEQVSKRQKNNLINYDIKKKRSYLKIFFKNVFTILNFVIFSCGLIIFSIGLYKRLFFLVTITLNTAVNFFQDFKLQKILNSLSFSNFNRKAYVLREGKIQEVPFNKLVLSDIVKLKDNSIVPCDSKILEGSVFVDESFLTGEQKRILKKEGDILIGETIVVNGECKVEIIKVGKANYISKLREEISVFSRPKCFILSNLVKNIRRIALGIFFIVSLEVFIAFLKEKILDINIIDSIVSSLLSMISTGIFLLFSLSLILWALKLLSKNILVNEVSSVENLISTNVLCLDKTGTITSKNIKYKEIIDVKGKGIDKLESILCAFINNENENNLTIKSFKEIKPKEKINVEKYISFTSEKKHSAIISNNKIYVLGACGFIKKISNFDFTEKEVSKYERNGFRTLILAEGELSTNKNGDDPEYEKLETIGIVLLLEEINKNVKETITFLKNQNIKIVVISGDSDLYLKNTMERSGISDCKIASLHNVDSDGINKLIDDGFNVFARSNPEQKKTIIEIFKNKYHLNVTMLGDGVNDLKALKIADCSISMPNGHDIVKKISNFVLLDSDFKNIIFLLSESNKIILNIQNIYTIFFSKIFSMILLSFFYLFFSLKYGLFFPFKVNNLMIWEMIPLGIGPILISLDKNNVKTDINNFFNFIFSNAFLSSLLIIFTYFSNFFGYFFNFLTYKAHICLSMISITFVSIFIIFMICLRPINKFRFFSLFSIFSLSTLFFLADYLLFVKRKISLLDFDYSSLNTNAFYIIMIEILFVIIYYFLMLKNKVKRHKK